MKHNIFIVLGLIISACLILIGCSSSSSDTVKADSESHNDVCQETCTSYFKFNFQDWVDEFCSSLNNALIEQAFRKSFNIYHMKLDSFIESRKIRNTKFLTNTEDFNDFVNSIIVGKVSAKSLEQIINTEFDNLITQSPNLRIHHINISYIDTSSLLPQKSVEYIISRFEDIKSMDISKKEKKLMYNSEVTSELLRNICISLDKQNILNQIK